jgi:uncharacterized protein (TIGR00730 family)
MQLMKMIKSICVYCGSGPGTDPAFSEAAGSLGRLLAAADIRLVYGGGSIGLMGTISSAVLERGGKVTGIIPEFLTEREHLRESGQEIIITRDMHERKRLMFERADAFVALPGGIGTLEELVEQLTWAQLGRHKKPILVANIHGFWDPFCMLLDHMEKLKFIRAGLTVDLIKVDQVEQIIPSLQAALRGISERELSIQITDSRNL